MRVATAGCSSINPIWSRDFLSRGVARRRPILAAAPDGNETVAHASRAVNLRAVTSRNRPRSRLSATVFLRLRALEDRAPSQAGGEEPAVHLAPRGRGEARRSVRSAPDRAKT